MTNLPIVEGTGVPKLVLGQKLYIPCYYDRIIVEAIIEELHDIYGNQYCTIWHSYDVNGMNEASIRIKNENGQADPAKPLPVNEIPILNLPLLNQFPWTSFPTWGHAAYIGDDAHVTLEEARSKIGPSNKKHLLRRLKAATKWTRKEFPNYRLKPHKVYVRNY